MQQKPGNKKQEVLNDLGEKKKEILHQFEQNCSQFSPQKRKLEKQNLITRLELIFYLKQVEIYGTESREPRECNKHDRQDAIFKHPVMFILTKKNAAIMTFIHQYFWKY